MSSAAFQCGHHSHLDSCQDSNFLSLVLKHSVFLCRSHLCDMMLQRVKVVETSHLERSSVSLFLDTFTKLWKFTVSFIMSVCPSTSNKSVEKIQVPLMSDKNNGYFTWIPCTFMILSCSLHLRMGNVLDKSCRENQNTRSVFSNLFFFLKIIPVRDKVEKCFRTGQR